MTRLELPSPRPPRWSALFLVLALLLFAGLAVLWVLRWPPGQ